MDYYIFTHICFLLGIKTVFTESCGTVAPREVKAIEGQKNVTLTFTPNNNQTSYTWHFSLYGNNVNPKICWSNNSSCVSKKYNLQQYDLSIQNVTGADTGRYTVFCRGSGWSTSAEIIVTQADNEQQVHLKTTKEYKFKTHSVTTTVESEKVKYEVIDSARDYKVSSTLEDTSQVTLIIVAGVVALGVVLTVIVAVKICKKQKKDDSHRASQKSGPTQTNSIVADCQDNRLPKDSGQQNSCQQSERMTSAVQHETEHNPGASSILDQQESSSAAEQIDSEYAIIVVPKKDRIPSTLQKKTKKEVVREEEGTPEYTTVVKSRQPGYSVEQSTEGGKDKNEHGLVYADLDLVSRPQREAVSKKYEATEYVSVDFQKTATL